VKGYAGQAMRIMIQNGSGTMQAQKTFTATGNWQRIVLTLASAGATATNWRAVVQRDAVASAEPFWTDGWQFENKAYATTFIYGDEKGLGYIDREYYWAGSPFASASVRSAFTRHGGKLVKINDYAIINKVVGLGMGKFESHVSELAMGGSVLQSTIRQPRPFSFLLTFKGSSQDAIYANRQVIIDAIRPDRDNQPLVLRYQGLDSSGNEATQPIDIICKAEISLQDTPNLPTRHTDLLSFTALDATLDGAYYEGSYLLYSQQLTVNRIVRQKPNGEWDIMGTGLQEGYAYAFAEAPNGDIYIGGSFTSAGGVANTSKIAKWSKQDQTWKSVLSGTTNNDIKTLCFGPKGELYVGGDFTNLAGSGIALLAYITDLDTTPTIHVFGDPVGYYIQTIDIDRNGTVYVGGIFSKIGGQTINNAAYYNGTWNDMGFTADDAVFKIKCGYFGNKVIIGGNMPLRIPPNIVCWDGTQLCALGSGLDGIIADIVISSNNTIIAVGQIYDIGDDPNNIHMALYNGYTWSGIPFGSPNGPVHSITSSKTGYYIIGDFDKVGNLSLTDRIANYSNNGWSRVGINLPAMVTLLGIKEVSDGTLYISGKFSGTAVVAGVTISNVYNSSSSANVYPTIQIIGPGTLLSIENKTTGKKIDFEGLILNSNEYITLHLDPHNLKFESNWSERGSIYNYITAGSDIANFNLAPGINNISVYMPYNTTQYTGVWITWKPNFWSLDGAIL